MKYGLKWFLASTVLIAGLALVFSASPAVALNPQPLPPGDYFGPVTLSVGQSMRINLANLGSSAKPEPPDPCDLLVLLVDASGNILNGNGNGQIFTIEPGQSTNVQYPPPATVTSLTTAAPGEVRAVVLSLTPLPASCDRGKNSEIRGASEEFLPPDPCIHWVFEASLEVLDASGQTIHILNPLLRFMLNPQPLPPG